MSTLIDHFHDGGWGMFPTMLSGLLLLAVAIRYAVEPERRLVPLLVSLNVLTLGAGALGFVSGCIVCARYFGMHDPQLPGTIPVMGVGEALNNVAFALLFVVSAAVAMSLGAWRIAREREADAKT
jgi:hypothetical protein